MLEIQKLSPYLTQSIGGPVQWGRVGPVHGEVWQQDILQVVNLVRLQGVQSCVQAHKEVLVKAIKGLLRALLKCNAIGATICSAKDLIPDQELHQ